MTPTMPNPNDPLLDSYEKVPYTSLSFHESHPDRLATLARLFGLQPAPVENCRVLELGCASGGNLIPMAYSLPGSHFTGIDYSARQIAAGQAEIAALGLKNIELQPRNLLDIGPQDGLFDYILAHGVYSWVPPQVQDRLLAVCRQNLAPYGVAYVSYNTFPGWRQLGMLREMMLYHTRATSEPEQRVAQSRELVQFLAAAAPQSNHSYGAFLQAYSQFLDQQRQTSSNRDSSFMLHDELETFNQPVYFTQFIEHAAGHGLQYLADAHYAKMQPYDFPPEIVRQLSAWVSDRIEFEQYLDFMRNQTFRQSLLCHQEAALNRRLKPEDLAGFWVAARLTTEAGPEDLTTSSTVRFIANDGAALATDHPTSKVALAHLGQIWPEALPFEDLLQTARSRLSTAQEPGRAEELGRDRQVLAENILNGYAHSSSLIELHTYSPNFAHTVSSQPVASLVARRQALTRSQVTNLRHERVSLDSFSRYLLLLLDGAQDHAALLARFLAGPVADGVLALKTQAGAAPDPAELPVLLSAEIENHLAWLARAALLVR